MNERLLIADDEEDILELLKFHLSAAGYEVDTAGNGLQMLHLARLRLPDLILVDLLMDGIDGLSACQILRDQPSTADTAVIVLTPVESRFARTDCLRAGASDCVAKPFNLEDLTGLIGRTLDQRRRRLERALARMARMDELDRIQPIF